MAKYTGKPAIVDIPAAQIAEKFDDLSQLSGYTDKIPAEERAKMGDLRFERDAIIIKNPAVGEMAFKVVEHNADRVVFRADGMLPLTINVNLKALESGSKTEVTTVLDIEIPAMLRPLIGGKLQQVADTFGDLIGKLAATPGA